MVDTPLVSIVLPCFNHAEFVQAAIESVCAQTHPRLELVVVDDGSTDGSHLRIAEMRVRTAGRFERFLYIRQKNRGIGAALNRAIDLTCGEFVSPIDADDVFLPDKISSLLESSAWRDPRVAMLFGDAAFIDAKGRRIAVDDSSAPVDLDTPGAHDRFIGYYLRGRSDVHGRSDLGRYAELLVGNYVPSLAVLMRREHLLAAGRYDPALSINDWGLWLPIARRFRLIYVDAVVGCYRWHATNTVKAHATRLLGDSLALLARERAHCRTPELEAAWRRGFARHARELYRRGRLIDFRRAFKRGNPYRTTRELFRIAREPGSDSEIAWLDGGAITASVGGRPSRRVWIAGRPRSHAEGIEPLAVFDGRLEADMVDGSPCVAFVNPGGSAQAYFRLTRPCRFAGAIEVTVEALADADGDGLHVEYDSLDEAVRIVPSFPGAFKRTPAQPLPPGGKWHRLTFRIDDARSYPSLHNADFRIVSRRARDLPLRLRRLEVSLPRGSEDRPASRLNGLAFVTTVSPAVSIIVPTRDRLEMLCDCLHALRRQTTGDYEVIVVDDQSSDGTVAALESVPGLRLVALAANGGFARACNAGARAARAGRLLFLNNDTIPLAGWLEPMLRALDADPTVAIVGSRLLYPGARVIQHAGVELAADGPRLRLKMRPASAPEALKDSSMRAVTGACMLVRRDVFSRLGGFDEAFFNGYEDVDLCLRAGDLGFLVWYCASSVLLHHESASSGRLDGASERANSERFRRRWRRRLPRSPGAEAS